VIYILMPDIAHRIVFDFFGMFHGNQTCRDSVIENEFSLFFQGRDYSNITRKENRILQG